MRKEERYYFKITKGISKSKSEKEACQQCLYHNRQKVCQIHLIKTRVDDTCADFIKKRKISVFRGGSVSPR